MDNDQPVRIARPPWLLTVPGLANSGPGHWQTLWERQRDDCHRAELGQWDQPHRNSWVNRLNLAITAAKRPVVLVAHSLGCLAVAWWASLATANATALVAGALLVAPPDVDSASCDPRLSGFAPAPTAPLPFPAIVVASQDDPYLTVGAARRLARLWQAGFADAGPIGHINAASGIGDWPFGRFLLDRLLAGTVPAGNVPAGNVPAGTVPAGASNLPARPFLPPGNPQPPETLLSSPSAAG